MGQAGLTLDDAPEQHGDARHARLDDESADARLRALVDAHYAFIWRSLRRLGVQKGDVDDGVQKVFLTASRKLDHIQRGSEKSFLFQTALRVASDSRRATRRRREVGEDATDPTDLAGHAHMEPDAEQMIDLHRARARLDTLLDAMPLELRAVFVLYELDEIPTADIATLLDVPVGTVSSRLRRARADFSARVARMQRSEGASRGGPR